MQQQLSLHQSVEQMTSSWQQPPVPYQQTALAASKE